MMIRKSDDWLVARTSGEIMMMNAKQGTYLGLNAMGARIWDLLSEPRDRDYICARLLEEFEVSPAVCGEEVDLFLKDLEHQKAIEFVPAST